MTIIEKVKALLSKHDIDPKSLLEEATKMEEAKLKTGETIQTEGDWAVGVSAVLVTEDGTMPLPEGSYALEDGTAFEVDADGIVLVWGEAEEGKEMSAPLTEEKVADMIKSAISVMTDEFAKVQAEKSEEKENEKLADITKQLDTLLSKPDANSSKKPVKTLAQKALKDMTKQERIYHTFNSTKK